MASFEEATVKVRVNGQEATKEVERLEKKVISLRREFTDAFKRGDTAEIKRITKELKAADKELQSMRTNAQNISAAMKRLDQSTPKELRNVIRQINNELNSGRVARGSKEWQEYCDRLTRARAELRNVQTQIGQTQTATQKIGGVFTKMWGTYTLALGGAMMAWSKLEGFMQGVNAKEDSKANLQALTGLSETDIAWLTAQADKLSTSMDKTGLRCKQSSREILDAFMLVGSNKPELLQSKEALAQVTTEAIRLATAANMELEPAVNAMTTALNQYGAGAEDAAKFVNILAAGSKVGAANVEQQSAAVLRAGTAASSANVSMEQLVGCIEMLGEKGIKGEVAGTGLKKFFLTLQTGASETNPKVVGLSQAMATLKAQVDAAEAKTAGGGAGYIKKMFGEEGYASASAIIDNIGKVEEYTKAVTGTSVAMEQAAINSKTASAQMAQMRNQLNAAGGALAAKLTPALLKVLPLLSKMGGMLNSLIGFLAKNKGATLTLVAAVVSYQLSLIRWNTITQSSMLLQKAWNAILAISQNITSSLTAVYNLCAAGVFKLTGNTVKATEAMNAFKAASASNIFGAIAAVLGTLAVVMMSVGKETDKVSAKTEALNEAAGRAAEGAEAEKQALQANIEKLSKFNGTRAEELELCSALNQKYGPVLGTYNTVAQWLSVLKKRGDEYTKTVYAQIEAEAKLEAARQLIGQAAKLREEAKQIDPDYYNKLMAHVNKFGNKLSLPVSQYPAGEVGIYRPGGGKGTPGARVDEKLNQAEKLEKAAKELTAEAAKVNRTVGAVTPMQAPNITTPKNVVEADGGTPKTKVGGGRVAASSRARGIKDTKEKEEQATAVIKQQLAERTEAAKKAADINWGLYVAGQRDYLQYMQERDKIEADANKAKMDDLEKAGLKETQVYKTLLKEQEKYEQDKEANRQKYSAHQLEQEYKADADKATADYFNPRSGAFQDQKALSQKLFELEVELLRKKQAIYEKGSDEYISLQEQIDGKVAADKLKKQEETAKAYKSARDLFANADAKQQLQMAQALLDKLKEQKLLSDEEYYVASNRLRRQYEENQGNKSATGNVDLTTTKQKADARKADLKADLDAEKARYEAGEIQEEEYQRNCSKIRRRYRQMALEEADVASNEYANMLTRLVTDFQDIFDSTNWEDMFSSLTGALTDAVAVMSAVMGQMSSYYSACRDVEVAKTEKSYDAQIKAAGKNQRKAKKLEEQKQAEIAKIKKKYNDRAMAMQIAQAVAETAVAAINAYASASKVNWLLGPIAAAMAIAAGSIQIATIKKQHEAEAVGYYEGGFTSRRHDDRTEVGVVHANEFVANHQAVANPVISPLLSLIDHAQRNNTVASLTANDVAAVLPGGLNRAGLLDGGRSSERGIAAIDEMSSVVVAVGEAQASVLSKLNDNLDKGVHAYVVLDGEKGLHRQYTNYQKLISSNKR